MQIYQALSKSVTCNRCSDLHTRRVNGAHPSPYPLPSAFLTLGGEQILFTNSFAEFTLLCCAQVTSEALGEVLVVEQDGANRVQREPKSQYTTTGSMSLKDLGRAANQCTTALPPLPPQSAVWTLLRDGMLFRIVVGDAAA